LSTWFRDYVYIPLGGNRVVKWRWYYNLFITFLVSGLWHGANWTFVVWGALHGFYLVFAIWTTKIRNILDKFFLFEKFPALGKIVKMLITFVLVYFAWIFFRANSLSDAILIIKNTFAIVPGVKLNLFEFSVDFYISFICIGLLLFIEIFEEQIQLFEKLKLLSRPVKWAMLVVIILTVIIIGVWEEADFLYFQF
jgi:D-alanyl-lipoteichoic acid acyltransferase DltB (MBOAT superfamily)